MSYAYYELIFALKTEALEVEDIKEVLTNYSIDPFQHTQLNRC